MSSFKRAFKNSLKKFSIRSSFQRQRSEPTIKEIDHEDVDAKRIAYRESLAKPLVYKDVLLPGDVIYPKVLDDLPDFEIRVDDIWLISYPQSGSAAVEEILKLIVNKMNGKMSSRRPREVQVAQVELANPYGHIRWLKGLRSPRIMCTNLPIELIPDQVKQTVCKVIYLVRNPKDHAVAYYYHHRVKGITSSLNDFMELYMNGHLMYGDWFSHVANYWQLCQTFTDNTLFVSYEEIRIETKAITKLIVKFLGYDLNDAEIDEIIDTIPRALDKDEVTKKNPTTTTAEEMVIPKTVPQSKFQGIIGDWQNYLSPEQSRQMDELYKTKLAVLNLSMCFDATDALKRLQQFGRIIIDKTTATTASSTASGALKAPSRKRRMGSTRRPKVIANVLKNKVPELTDDEKVLLRTKSFESSKYMLSPVMESQPEIKKKSLKNCCTTFLAFICPCFFPKKSSESYDQL